MKILITYLLLSTLVGLSQNRETSFALQIQYGIYSFMNDSLGIQESDSLINCGCDYYFKTKFSTTINKDEKDSPTLDSDLLDWVDDETTQKIINKINQDVTSNFRGKTKSIFVEVDVRRLWIRYNIFKLKWKVKYNLTVRFNLTPLKK